ncbi:unnamed protein product [Amaranthus hypochondriacus]
MKPRNSTSLRGPGQRSIPSTFLSRRSHPCFRNNSNGSQLPSEGNNRSSNLSLGAFLNSKLHKTSVLPIDKDKNTFSVLKEDKLCPTAVDNSLDDLVFKDKQYAGAGGRDERGHVIEDSVFKLFNDSGERVRKRSPDRLTASRFECNSKRQSQDHLLVLGDDPKPKRRNRGEVSCSSKKPRPFYNYYESGTGWWEPEREGVDNDEVGSKDIWEGMGSTTLGGLDWN